MSLWHGDTAGGWTAPGRHLPPDGLSTGLPDHGSPAASSSRRHWRAESQPRLTASRTRRGPELGAASLSVRVRGPPFVRGSGCLPRERGCPPSACVATQGSFWNTGQGSVPSPAEPPPASLRAGAAGNTARSWPPAPCPRGPRAQRWPSRARLPRVGLQAALGPARSVWQTPLCPVFCPTSKGPGGGPGCAAGREEGSHQFLTPGAAGPRLDAVLTGADLVLGALLGEDCGRDETGPVSGEPAATGGCGGAWWPTGDQATRGGGRRGAVSGKTRMAE